MTLDTKETEAARSAGDVLEQSLLKAAHSLERELARIMKAGEDDLDRLARRIAETLARLAMDGVLGGTTDAGADASLGAGSNGSLNQVAAALARAARRGARFT